MKYIIAAVILIVCAIPALTGFVDTLWWFYTDHALSSIEWTGGRIVFAYTLAAVGFLSSMGVANV